MDLIKNLTPLTTTDEIGIAALSTVPVGIMYLVTVAGAWDTILRDISPIFMLTVNTDDTDFAISIDTTSPAVAAAPIEAGAHLLSSSILAVIEGQHHQSFAMQNVLEQSFERCKSIF